jgi:membrane fusion protein (multidrug efflux system)
MGNAFSRTCRSLANDTSQLALVIWGFGTVLLSAWLAWFFLGNVTVYEVSTAARLEVERAAHKVTTPVAGQIIASSIKLRRRVTAGEVLLTLDATAERLRLQEEEARLQSIPPQLAALERQIADEEQAARRSLAAASSAVAQARARHREATATAGFAQENSRRLEVLGASGRVAEIEALRARTETVRSRSAADALEIEIERVSTDTLAKRDERRASLESLRREAAALQGARDLAQATIARLRQDIERHVIRAPIAGVIGTTEPLDAGAFVEEGGVLASIIPSGNLRVVAQFVPARALGRVAPGQTAHLRLEGFPWLQFGTVRLTVAQVASEIRDGYVRVELLPDARERLTWLQHGLPGSVEVEIERTAPASLLMRAAGQALTRPAVSRVATNDRVASAQR